MKFAALAQHILGVAGSAFGQKEAQRHPVLVTNERSGKKNVTAEVTYPQLLADLNEGLNDLICVGEDLANLMEESMEEPEEPQERKRPSRKKKRKHTHRVKAS